MESSYDVKKMLTNPFEVHGDVSWNAKYGLVEQKQQITHTQTTHYDIVGLSQIGEFVHTQYHNH